MHTSKESNSVVIKSPFTRNILFLFRVALGLMLFIKGINFIRNDGILRQVLSEAALIKKLSILELLIPLVHILGGFFILIGIYTRKAAMVQLPLVIGAIFVLLNAREYAFFNTEMFFAITILLLLLLYLKFGDGFYSWGNLIKKEKDIL
ncbi:MAG: hypothetical protein RLZ10_2885 [Bacteroidota bacterium]|jgi:uncharacterized membrane protein YphA (DoxX/SURF4 family)